MDSTGPGTWRQEAVRRLARTLFSAQGRQRESWCHLGRHWFVNWGSNSVVYREREVCVDCRDRALKRLLERAPKWRGSHG